MFVLKNINFYVCPVCVWFRICCFSFSRIFSCIERCPWVSYKASPNQIYYFLYFLVCHHPLFQQPSRTSLLQHESRSTPRTHGATGSPGVRCRQVQQCCPEVSRSSHRNIIHISFNSFCIIITTKKYMFYLSGPEVRTLKSIHVHCTARSTNPDKHSRRCI